MSSQNLHVCPEPNCERTFKRREHLSRHRLNHKPKRIYTCEECQKNFVRVDLLQRHQQRHERGMVLRNSGGYQGPTNGRYTNMSPSVSLTEDVSVPLARASQSPAFLSRPLIVSEATDDTSEFTEDPSQALTTSTRSGGGAELTTFLLPTIHTGFQSHLFFDPSSNIEDTVADLDWLFGTESATNGNQSTWHGFPASAETLMPSESPTSILSDHPSTDLVAEGDLLEPWRKVRERIVAALGELQQDLLDSSFFEPVALRSLYEGYFTSYHAHFPILHPPTMHPETMEPLLLISLLSLGATVSPEMSHYLVAERIHDHLRWLIFSSGAFQPPAPLWLLQALLLVQAYEKMASSRKHHEMSHIFHSAVITLMRRGTSYNSDMSDNNSSRPGGSDNSSSLKRTWHQWVEQECSKRVAYFAFVMDAQHASIFGHTPTLSVSDLRIPLPYSEEVWESSNPSKWKRTLANQQTPTYFLPTLRLLLSGRPLPASCSPFSRFVLLHGLFSVMKYMQTRDITAMDVAADRGSLYSESQVSQASAPDENWKETIHRALDTWSFSLLSQEPSLCLEAARPLHRIAHIVIHIPLVDFHTFVGAPPLVGNSVTKDEHDKARSRLMAWSRTYGARRALSHCVLLIQETMFTRRRYHASEDIIALRPWCLYHASLVLWTYGVMTEGLPATNKFGAEEYLVHMLSGLLGDPRDLEDKNQTSGLLVAVREALANCRWQLLQEAQSTLERLINMVETE